MAGMEWLIASFVHTEHIKWFHLSHLHWWSVTPNPGFYLSQEIISKTALHFLAWILKLKYHSKFHLMVPQEVLLNYTTEKIDS